jgi:DNA (cytosine-5)-methyltransferase 1
MRELIIDSFAGGGGASEGIRMALGRGPDYAINHDREALAMHAANHPETEHLSKNIWQVDPMDVVGRRPVGLAWFSPDCKHFSKAKGGRPVKREIRDLAWTVILWAKRARPRVILLENVEEFRSWGPLVETDGKWMPCPDRLGTTFDRWVGELRRLGYKVEWRELRACDYGAPTIRKRLFLIARRDGKKIVWPTPTHGAPSDPDVISGRKLPWRTAAEIIDWSLPCHSIFLTREEGRAVGVNRPLAEATMERIARGVRRYVLDAARPFVVPLTHQGGDRARGLDHPLPTVTGANRGEQAIVTPVLAQIDCHACGERFPNKHYSGGLAPAECPKCGHEGEEAVAPHFTYAQQGGASRDPMAPLHTVTASRKDQNALVAAHLTKFRANSVGSSMDEPAHTVTANSFVKRPGCAAPIGVVAAHVQRQFGNSVGSDAESPVGTVTAGGGGKTSVVAAFLAQHNLGVVARDARDPLSTITSTGAQQQVVSAGLLHMKGSDRRMSDVEEPARTVMAGGLHQAEVRAFLQKYYGTGGQDQSCEDPLHTATTKARMGLVMVEGEPYQIVDIGMRMLSPRELFRAQGFRDSYTIDRGVLQDGTEIKLTKTASIRMCGNSVSPVMAHALVAANVTLADVEQVAQPDIFAGVAA